MRKRLFVILMSACLALSACGGSSATTTPAQTSTEIQTTKQSNESTSEQFYGTDKRKTDLENVADYIIDTKTALSAALGSDNYSVKKVYDYIMIEMWMDGVAVNVAKASEGDEACLSAWETTKESIQDMSKIYYDNLSAYSLSDWHVTVSVLNDLDHSKALLTYTDGELSYDCLVGSED